MFNQPKEDAKLLTQEHMDLVEDQEEKIEKLQLQLQMRDTEISELKHSKETKEHQNVTFNQPKEDAKLLTQEHMDMVEEQGEKIEKLQLQLQMRENEISEDKEFATRLRESDVEEKRVFPKDQKLAATIYMTGFSFEKSKLNKAQAEAFLDGLFPRNSFVVTKVREVCKGKDKYHVTLTTSDDANKICSDYRRCHFTKDNQRSILKVASAETLIRFKILEVIETELEKRYSTNKPYVGYVKCKPSLFVFEDGAYKQYQFTAALQKFRTLLDKLDFEGVHQFAFSKNIRGDSLKQYIVL
jgi:hypothetical protein